MVQITPRSKAAVITNRDLRVIWEKLKKCYESASRVPFDAKLARLYSIRIKWVESQIEFSIRFQNLVNELQAARYTVAKLETRRALLRRLRKELTIRAETTFLYGIDCTTTVSNLDTPKTIRSEYEPT